MRARQAADIFQLDLETLDVGAITRAFADATRAAHPDNGGDPDLAPAQIEKAKLARKTLTAYMAARERGMPAGADVCRICDGKGTVRSMKLQPITCPSCRGEGWRYYG